MLSFAFRQYSYAHVFSNMSLKRDDFIPLLRVSIFARNSPMVAGGLRNGFRVLLRNDFFSYNH